MPASRQPRTCISPVSTLLLPLHPPLSLTMSTMSSDTIVGPGTRCLCNHKAQDKKEGNQVPKMPSHWVFERDRHPPGHAYFCWWPFFHFLHHLFCAISFGHSNLYHVWELSYPGCSTELWEHGRDLQRERMEHINIMVRFPSESR